MRLDDDDYLDSPSGLIGEVELVVSRTTTPKRIGKKKMLTIEGPFEQPPSDKVHESKKKGMAHRVMYVSTGSLFNT